MPARSSEIRRCCCCRYSISSIRSSPCSKARASLSRRHAFRGGVRFLGRALPQKGFRLDDEGERDASNAAPMPISDSLTHSDPVDAGTSPFSSVAATPPAPLLGGLGGRSTRRTCAACAARRTVGLTGACGGTMLSLDDVLFPTSTSPIPKGPTAGAVMGVTGGLWSSVSGNLRWYEDPKATKIGGGRGEDTGVRCTGTVSCFRAKLCAKLNL